MIFIAIFIFLSIGIYASVKIYQNIQYKKTNEYKLLNIGYTLEEIDLLEDKLDNEYIDTLINKEKDDYLLTIIQEKYFLKRNITRYLEYHEKYENTNPSLVIALVNTNNDYKYYEHDIDTDTSKEELLLVNKYYHLTEDYVPEDLVKVSNKYYYGENHQVREKLYNAFINMWNAAYKEDIYLIMNSTYREYSEQLNVYKDYERSIGSIEADKIAARAGYSEHQTGLAIDVFSTKYTTTSNFKDSDAYLWLKKNAYKYGFIERYPEDKENITGFQAEAWHWRYVGVEVATYIQENKITFDEYYAYFIEK